MRNINYIIMHISKDYKLKDL